VDKSRTLHTFILLIVISLIFIISNNLPIVKVAKNIFIKIMFPLSKTIEYPVDKFGSIYHRSKLFLDLYDKSITLQNKITQLNKKYLDIDYLEKENKRLENLLGLQESSLGKLISAKVIAQLSENYFSDFNIDKGENHGLKIDLPVLTVVDSKWVLIGRIKEVYKDFSKVVLITSSDFRCAADVYPVANNLNTSEVVKSYQGVIKGNNNWMLNLEYISPDADIEKGGEVYTSGNGGIFPGGLLVGNVIDIKDLKFSTGKKAFVKGAFYPQNAKFIFILVKK